MTEHIDNLRSSLFGIAGRCFPADKFLGKPEAMNKELERVRATFNRSSNATPPKDRIFNAIATFLQTKNLEDSNQARLISWGISLPHAHGKPLLELHEPFANFLSSIKVLLSREEFPVKAWRGLLFSYFNYSGPDTKSETGSANWMALRIFLNDTFPSILGMKKVKPAWLLTLEQHLNLLNDKPCERYAYTALQGDTAATEELQRNLAIPQTSWLIGELICAQVKHACSLEDSRYKEYLPQLITTLRKHILYAHTGLIELLTRYSHCTDTSEHSELSRYAVEYWGNPKLPGNQKWGHVDPNIKAMVLKWLIGRDLETFFDLMASDHHADQDKRRLKFWRRYLGSIHDAYFVLGYKAWSSQNENYVELRRRNEGRVAKLVHPDQRNNAFIMLVGKYVIVEFGATGTACYCFDRDNLPFRLNVSQLAGDVTGLKNKTRGYKFHIAHIDRRGEDWEETFEQRLLELGIEPDQSRSNSGRPPQARQKKRTDRSGSSRRDSYSEPTLPIESPFLKFEIEELKDFVGRFGLKVIDFRNKGGNLWVKPDCDMLAVQNQLRRWNFQRKVGTGWWIK